MLVLTVAIATVASTMQALSRPVTISVDGQRIVADVPPVTSAVGTYVPLRAIGDSLGADTFYDPKTGHIELLRGNTTLRMAIGQRIATLDGRRMTLAHAPFTVRGRTMVGLGAIAKAFEMNVREDGARAKVDVVTPGLVEAGAQDDTAE